MMSKSYDVFLSHSGYQKDFVEHLNAELAKVCGHYTIFFDRDSIEHGDQISSSILEYAGTCKLTVAVLSEEYFTRSMPPMKELAASYTAAKATNGSPSLPCLLPVFLALRPEDVKDSSTQTRWWKMWQKWEVNETMSERRKSKPSRVQPTVWKEAVDRLLDNRGPVYIPKEYGYDPDLFMKKVAQVIARKLDYLNGHIGSSDLADQLKFLYKEVDPTEDSGVEEESNCENSAMDSSHGPVFNPQPGSGSSRVAGKGTEEKDALPKSYRLVVCLEFCSTYSSFAFSHISYPEAIHPFYDYPGSDAEKPSCRTVTGIYYSSRDGGKSYQVKSWGNPARSSYERGEREAGRLNENFFGMYVTRFNPHLKVRDTQITSSKKQKLPYSLPVDRPITDFLHEFGAYILNRLQGHYGPDLSMKMIQWCVPVPTTWDNAAQEKMKACMESAGLINGTDGSPYPIKMVGELEAASLDCLKRNKLQRKVGEKLLVVDIGDSFFHIVLQEIVSVCNHIHRVKEVSSRLFTRLSSSPDTEFVRLLHRKIGPGVQELLIEHPTEYKTLINQWDSLKYGFGDATSNIGEPIEIQVWKRLSEILERGFDKQRILDVFWDRDEDGVMKISYRECQSLFDPVVEEILSCISGTCSEVGGVRSLVLVGNWLATSPYVMDNIRRRFARQVPEITSPLNYDSATCQGAVALAKDLCYGMSNTS